MPTLLQRQEQAIGAAVSKAEIAIDRILRDLEHATMRKVKLVSVDTQNFKTPSAEIFLQELQIKVEVVPIGTAASEIDDGFKHTYALRASGGWVYKGGSRKGLWCPVEDAADVPQRFKDAVASFMAEHPASGS